MTTSSTEPQLDQRMVRVLAHPLRQQLLIMLHKHGVSSPRQLAERSGERLPNVSYHMRVLRDAGCIELVRTKPRRGAIEHFYRASARPILDDDQWASLPISVRRALFGQTLRELWDDVLAAANTGGFDDPQAHVSRAWFQLDEIAWNELVDVLAGVLDKAFELQAQSAARLGRGDQETARRVAMGLLLFERAEGAPPQPKPAKRS
jgi:DNA-binding transcriptional ArsR family regulator